MSFITDILSLIIDLTQGSHGSDIIMVYPCIYERVNRYARKNRYYLYREKILLISNFIFLISNFSYFSSNQDYHWSNLSHQLSDPGFPRSNSYYRFSDFSFIRSNQYDHNSDHIFLISKIITLWSGTQTEGSQCQEAGRYERKCTMLSFWRDRQNQKLTKKHKKVFIYPSISHQT